MGETIEAEAIQLLRDLVDYLDQLGDRFGPGMTEAEAETGATLMDRAGELFDRVEGEG